MTNNEIRQDSTTDRSRITFITYREPNNPEIEVAVIDTETAEIITILNLPLSVVRDKSFSPEQLLELLPK